MAAAEPDRWGPGLSRALDGALGELDPEERIVVLFSGGLDSGILAHALAHRPGLALVTAGFPGSADLAAASEGAAALGLPWRRMELGEASAETLFQRLAPDLADGRPTDQAVQLALALAVESAPAGTLVCGQGADELFLGYAHFRDLDAAAAERRATADLVALQEREWPHSVRIARSLGRALVAPYLSPGFIEAARAIPIQERLPGGQPKLALRTWARMRGVPPQITERPKRAFQYGSGVGRFLERRRARA